MPLIVIKSRCTFGAGVNVHAKFPPAFTKQTGLSQPKFVYESSHTLCQMTITFTIARSLDPSEIWVLIDKIIAQLALEQTSMICEYQGDGVVCGRMC